MANPNNVAIHRIRTDIFEPASQAEMIAASEQLHRAVQAAFVAWTRGAEPADAHDKIMAVFDAMAVLDVAIGRNP